MEIRPHRRRRHGRLLRSANAADDVVALGKRLIPD
jgi:hypothetical protein